MRLCQNIHLDPPWWLVKGQPGEVTRGMGVDSPALGV